MDQLLPILLSFQEDEIRARRHWPWAAWAISQYDFEKRELAKYTDEPTPKEVRDLLLKINEAAHDLGSGLVRLNDLSERLADPTAPARRAHLAWLAEFISQFIDGKISNDIGENDRQILANHFKKESLLNYLVNVEVAAKAAMQRVDRSTLERKRGQDPALANFILRCGKIWEGLRGRKPNAEKSSSMRDPPFVRFIRDLAKSAKLRPPSRNQVATSLRKFHTRN